jgi:hypothetical protein
VHSPAGSRYFFPWRDAMAAKKKAKAKKPAMKTAKRATAKKKK